MASRCRRRRPRCAGCPGRRTSAARASRRSRPAACTPISPVIGQRGLISGADEAERFVADRVAEGSDYIKIVVGSPFADHDQATHRRAGRGRARAGQARRRARLVRRSRWRRRRRRGADILTHAPLDQRAGPGRSGPRGRRRPVVIPTLTMMAGIVAKSPRRVPTTRTPGPASPCCTQAGVPILAGTDANDDAGTAIGCRHGDSLHRELELLVDAGLSTAGGAARGHLAARALLRPGRSRGDRARAAGRPGTDRR